MAQSSFRYVHLKISAQRLPGKGLRLDPLAVVFSGGPGKWTEVGRTEKKLNEWNPKFAQSITFPADSDAQRRLPIRVDFYNRQMSPSRFLGTCELNLYSLIAVNGRPVEFELATPVPDPSSPRVFLAALQGYNADSTNVTFNMQLMQTNYYGVSMKMFYEISRAGTESWFPVFKSPQISIDEQGWGQFPACTISTRELTMDEEATGLLFNLYRYRTFGPRRSLGFWQSSIKALTTMRDGDLLSFSANPKEDISAAEIQLIYGKKVSSGFEFSFRLVNVQWKAQLLTEPTKEENVTKSKDKK